MPALRRHLMQLLAEDDSPASRQREESAYLRGGQLVSSMRKEYVGCLLLAMSLIGKLIRSGSRHAAEPVEWRSRHLSPNIQLVHGHSR